MIILSRLKLTKTRALLYPIYFIVLPVVAIHSFWLELLKSGLTRAWDGTGHYGAALIYDQSIFPDTFGWTNAYFGGMPLPNLYPPLFYWCVAMLHHTSLFSFDTSFKLMVALPVLLIPAVIWALSLWMSDNNRHVAFMATAFSLYPLLDSSNNGNLRWASGVDYFSTFQIGLFSQPLGFVLLIAWYIVYCKADRSFWKISLSALLLALTILANFFNALIASIMIGSIIIAELAKLIRTKDAEQIRQRRVAMRIYIVTPLISVGLALFWLAPMASEYGYFVTRPFGLVFITPFMWGWYIAAAIGLVCWWRQPTRFMRPYLLTCLCLVVPMVVSKFVTLSWFPLQSVRFSNTLNYLLTIPIAYASYTLLRSMKVSIFRARSPIGPFAQRLWPYTVPAFMCVLLIGLFINAKWAERNPAALIRTLTHRSFYPSDRVLAESKTKLAAKDDTNFLALDQTETASKEIRSKYSGDYGGVEQATAIQDILRFARQHKDGRYLVEFPTRYGIETPATDGRAISSYLGAQGNESVVVVFREASPNSLFTYPQASAISAETDNFGISSTLADDLDFAEQPISQHLKRIQQFGVRYLVVNSGELKERLAKQPEIGPSYKFNDWTIFEFRNEPPPTVQVLQFRPALVKTGFTVKMRRRDEQNFIRLVEEQFSDGWFDVPLAYSSAKYVDEMGDLAELNKFGAVVLDDYTCYDCDLAFRRLRAYAQKRTLIMLMSHHQLFYRIRSSIAEFPGAHIIERNLDDTGEWVQNLYGPTYRYHNSPIRSQWLQIRKILENNKAPVEPAKCDFDIQQKSITVQVHQDDDQSQSEMPVLVRITSHPNWQREDGAAIYPATPMFMVTFVNGSTRLVYKRRLIDHIGLWASMATLVGLVGFSALPYRQHLLSLRRIKERKVADEPEIAT